MTVSAGGASGVFLVDANVTTTISGLTITGGNVGYGDGGGLANYGTTTLTDCTLSGNSANHGGGVYNEAGTVNLMDCTLSGNSAGFGAAVCSYGSSTNTLTDCTISGNSAGGKGAVFIYGGSTVLTGCTVSGNTAYDGAGLATYGSKVTLANCTVSGNSASGNGGGLYNRGAHFPGGSVTLTNCTISGNSADQGGGVYTKGTTLSYNAGITDLGNTIVAGNTAPTGPDLSGDGDLNSQGNNLIGETNDSSVWVGSDLTGTSAAPLDAVLAPLGNYGGPTQTMALLPGSPAIDAGNNALIPTGVTTDQRGLSRIVNGTVDIGAFESSGFTLAATSGSGQTIAGVPVPLVVTVTANNPIEPVAGGLVTFTPLGSGASAQLTGNPATIGASGKASVGATSNGVAGSYTVVALANGAAGLASFSLTNAPLVSIAVSPANPKLDEGVSGQFIATGTFAGGSTGDITDSVTWASATPTVATISGTGVATAVAPGTSAITASMAGVTSPGDTLTVIVSFVVNTTADTFGFYSGTTSLREAIASANAVPGQTITFDPTVFAGAQTITLSLGQLELSDISGTETITGPAAGVTVSGGGTSRVFQVDEFVTASISGLTITDGDANNGGGLADYGGMVALSGCTVSDNSASSNGGGVYLNNGGTATLTNCTLSDNSARFGGGLNNHGTATLNRSTISNNTASSSGGGLQTFGGTLKLTNCTVSGNSSANDGGGLYTSNGGTATLTNCTLSGNTASGEGGGLYNDAGKKSSHTTVTFGNTIAAGNTTGSLGPDVFGSFVSKGHNLIGETDGSTGWGNSDLTGTIASPLNPLLVPLGNYGGPTQTMALLPGSPAIDAGSNSLIPSGVTTDQRGLSRIVNGTVDIGAFESRGFTIAFTSGSGQSAGGWPTSSGFSAPLVVTVTAKNPIEPVAGGLVTFTAPASGASAALTGSPATISTSGTASVTATRNGVAGSYIVSAKARGAPGAVSFLLTNVALVSIAVSPGDPELAEGVAGQFTATGTYADGSTAVITPYVTWSSATASVATINDTTGVATALALGTSAITASRGGVTSPADTLTVIAPSFVVNTTADDFGFYNGTTSLREAITFANDHPGPTTITFALPAGSTTIHLLSPLPEITNPVVIDGTSQPGFAGTPLVDLTGQSLAISAAVTVRGVTFDGIAFGSAAVPEVLALPSVPFSESEGGPASAIDSYPFSTTTGEDLTAVVQALGVTTRLLLLDANGNVLMSSDGVSAADGDDLINLYVSAGTYTLEVQDLGGAGTYSLTATASLATSPLVPLAKGNFQTISSIVTGDFTGDGHLDLAFTSYGSGQLSSTNDHVVVLLSNGDGTFAPPVTYAVGMTAAGYDQDGIVAGDFNGDGHLDLAVANSGDNTVSVLMGNGDGTFQPQVTYRVGQAPQALVAGDFTGDGHLDLAVANSGDDTVSVLLGNGDGTFAPQKVTYAVGSSPDAILAGDFTGDGRIDLAVTNGGSNTVSVLLGNGDGTFAPQATYAVGNNPQGLVAGDFSGDGQTDLVVSDGDGIQILTGNGDGTFQPVRTIAAGISGNLVAGDFTGDGRLDLAVAGGGAKGTVRVLLNDGDDTFAPPVTYAVGYDPDGIVEGDFSGNGHLDLAVANQGQILFSAGSVSVLLGNGDGTFAPPVTYNLNENPMAIVAGDFTGDGHLDLAFTDQDYYVGGIELTYSTSALLGNGNGTFGQEVTVGYQNKSFGTAITAADFTEDGHLDLAVTEFSSATVAVLESLGDGTFIDPAQLATTPQATPLVADVNGDGTPDVLVVNSTGNILYRQGIPGQPGSFLPPVTVNPSNPSRDIAWLPNTSQGPVLASLDVQDDAIWFYAYRDGGFVKLSGSLPTGQFPAQIIAAQLIGNGLDDLVVRNAGDGTLSVYLGSWFRGGSVGPASPLDPPIFTAAFTLPVGLGVSDVQAVATLCLG